MSDEFPNVNPPSASAAEGAAVPQYTPSSSEGIGGGLTTWLSDKRVSGLWSINQDRNSWVYVTGVGWKRNANNADSVVVALGILAANAKAMQTSYNYREEADGLIHEVYVW